MINNYEVSSEVFNKQGKIVFQKISDIKAETPLAAIAAGLKIHPGAFHLYNKDAETSTYVTLYRKFGKAKLLKEGLP